MEFQDDLYSAIEKNKHFNRNYLINFEKYLKVYKIIEYSLDVYESYENLEVKKFYKLTGRILFKRTLGKIKFFEITNYGQKLQLIMSKQHTTQYGLTDIVNRGDIVFVEGIIDHSKTNILSLIVYKWGLISKTIMEHPDKVGGIKEQSVYKNKRFLELVYNDKLKFNLKMRSKLYGELRNILSLDGYLEIDVPTLERDYGGAVAKPFKTNLADLHKELYMSIAPQFRLKDLIFAGWNRVYALTHCFRNEGIDKTHHPQFAILEFYAQNKDYMTMAKYTMDMITKLSIKLKNTAHIIYDSTLIKLDNYKIISYHELLDRYYPIRELTNLKKLLNEYTESNCIIELEYILFDKYITPKLIQPTCVIDFPSLSTPLAKNKRGSSKYIQQCEIYVAGFELANIYSEVNSIYELAEKNYRHTLSKSHVDMLAYGQHIHGGVGIGIERLTMLFANETCIKNVMYFHL